MGANPQEGLSSSHAPAANVGARQWRSHAALLAPPIPRADKLAANRALTRGVAGRRKTVVAVH